MRKLAQSGRNHAHTKTVYKTIARVLDIGVANTRRELSVVALSETPAALISECADAGLDQRLL
jgi:hypothetical protein